jgi:hypothetical protein
VKRRAALAGLATLAMPAVLAGRPRTARAAQGAPGAGAPVTIVAGGPRNGEMDRWARALALGMSSSFPGQPMIDTQPVGGVDGVTAANRLDALVVPDGATAALLPGAAMIAWLVGDNRVQFSPSHWAPVLAGTTSCVIGVRNGLAFPAAPGTAAASGTALTGAAQSQPLRLAADRPDSIDLAALIACARMDVDLQPVPGLGDEQARLAAFGAGEVDILVLGGEGVPADAGVLEASGGHLVCSFGQLDDQGRTIRDPLFPSLPTVDELATATPELVPAWRAAAAASRLDMMLVLPRLIDPSLVWRWREAGRSAIASPALAAAADASAVTLTSASIPEVIFSALGAAPLDKATIHAVLHRQYGWQPA